MKLIKIFCGHRSTFLHLDTFVEKEMTEKEKKSHAKFGDRA